MIVTGSDMASQAASPSYNGISYEEKDCQGFVQLVLHDIGINEDWLGSNDMVRNMVDNVTVINGRYSDIPAGAILFTLKSDGQEPSRYKKGGNKYNADFAGINASHVGIYCGDSQVRHSTTGGVQWDRITSKRWTHYALHKKITYKKQDPIVQTTLSDLDKKLDEIISLLDSAIKELKR